jgi:hypothetical protein
VFYKTKAPARPSYAKTDAAEGVKKPGDADLKTWEPGKEIDLYNSRNIYTRGGGWGWKSLDGVDWVESAGDDYVDYCDDMVSKSPQLRVIWTGWTRVWGGSGVARAERLCVHKDDIYPRPQGRLGKGCIRTRRIDAAERIWKKVGGRGVRWASVGQLELEFSQMPDDEDLQDLGWKAGPDGGLIDIDTPLSPWIAGAKFYLPGHNCGGWGGLGSVVIKSSGKEGCVPGSFTVLDPGKAGDLIKGCDMLPSGCVVKVDDRYSLGAFGRNWIHWADGKISIPARKMVALNSSVKSVTLHLSRETGASFVVGAEDIDFSRVGRPVLGTYFGKNGAEKCFITKNIEKFKPVSSVTRSKILTGADKSYRVIGPWSGGRKISRQKMIGLARVRRLPSQDRMRRQKLEALYGDVVGEDYYKNEEVHYKRAAEERDRAKRDGYTDYNSAKELSAIPSELFDQLVRSGLAPAVKIATGTKYFKPVRHKDIAENDKIIETIVSYSCEREMAWLCHLVALSPERFKKALIKSTLAGH